MPSPSIQRYVDMEVYDSDAQTIFADAINRMVINVPGWVPREGNIEVVLMETLAEMVAETIYAINRVPDAVFQTLMALFGMDYQGGRLPKGHFLIQLADSDPITIPAGTEIALKVEGANEPLIFTVDTETTTPGGDDTVQVLCTGDIPTDAANGMNDTMPNPASMVTPLTRVVSVTLDPAFDPAVYDGISPESDDEFFDRAAGTLSRTVKSMVTGEDIAVFVREDEEIGAANYEVEGNGYNITMYGLVGEITTEKRDALLASIYANIVPGMPVVFEDPVVVALTVTAEIVVQPAYDSATVISYVKNALATKYSVKAGWWATTPTVTDIALAIIGVPGVKAINGAISITGGGTEWNELTICSAADVTITVGV